MIEWRMGESKYELISECGRYRIVKNPSVYPVEYTPQHLHETLSADGFALQSWMRIEKPKISADEAKEVCEKWNEQNNKKAKC